MPLWKSAVIAAFLGIGSARAQTNPFVGTWRGAFSSNGLSIVVSLVMAPDGSYTEQEQSGVGATMQSGRYVVSGDRIAFEVLDWLPKTMPVYRPSGYMGGSTVQEPVAKPPGGVYSFQFLSTNALMLAQPAGRVLMQRQP